MKREILFDAITDVRDDLIESAATMRPKPFKRLFPAIAAILAIAIAVTALILPEGGQTAHALAEPTYPQMATHPSLSIIDNDGNWYEDIRAQRQSEGYADGLEDYFFQSLQTFLSDTENENRVYSPLNLYMSLGMLAEITEGNSRQQILDLLDADSIETLRTQASSVWNASYRDDKATLSLLASSIWLAEGIDFRQDALDRLANIYYASSYQGAMGSPSFNRALQNWLNEHTMGLLEEEIKGVSLPSETIAALASTVSFRAKWTNEFNPNKTQPGIFHSTAGDVSIDFMHQSFLDNYCWGNHFSAVSKQLESDGRMWFFLPDEGTDVEALLNEKEILDIILNHGSTANSKYVLINASIPKFDVSSQITLNDGLQAMGITDVFDPAHANYSPLTEFTPIALSNATHSVRVSIDEEGCTAAAYTVMVNAGSAPPQEEVEFILDRPFLFIITNPDGLPLFVGIVKQP